MNIVSDLVLNLKYRIKTISLNYVGKYVNDKKEGFGVFPWPNGKIYKGQWKQGKQHGEGQMFCLLENTWKNGEWYEGRRVKWKD